jgi:dTDP-4-dehydrorhamnose reductase
MDFLVTGGGGQLGRALIHCAQVRGHSILGAGHAQVDVGDEAAVRGWVLAHKPRTVFHCAAWTDVDGCERDPKKAHHVHVAGTRAVARACKAAGAGLVHLSTDFVFDGHKGAPYTETDDPHPLSHYGQTKLLAEREVFESGVENHWVVRTQWLFGVGGKNFPQAILKRARAEEPLRVVDDQIGSPTYAMDLARALLLLIDKGGSGLYHAANSGSCSWFALARLVLEVFGMKHVPVAAIKSRELDRPAKRPSYSVLDTSLLTQTIGYALPDWRDALRRYFEEAKNS